MCWINELEEVDRYTSKREASDIKSEISRSTDRLRKPYAAEYELIKRGFIFGASTNDSQPLKDENNRRWLSIHIAKDIKFQLTPELRGSILGMGVSAYDNGENWWLDSEEEVHQTEINKEYTEENIYSDTLIPEIERVVRSNPLSIFRIRTCIDFLNERRNQKVTKAIKQVFKEYGLVESPRNKNYRGYQLPRNHEYVLAKPEAKVTLVSCDDLRRGYR